jgi:hypothetical protein
MEVVFEEDPALAAAIEEMMRLRAKAIDLAGGQDIWDTFDDAKMELFLNLAKES